LTEANSTLQFDKLQSMNESGELAYQLEQTRGSTACKYFKIVLSIGKVEFEKFVFLQLILSTQHDDVCATNISNCVVLFSEFL